MTTIKCTLVLIVVSIVVGYSAEPAAAATCADYATQAEAQRCDARRFSSSREAVRYAGLEITVHQSDARRAPGHLSQQGPSALRWALFEAAQCARRPASPDHDYYSETAARLGGNRACGPSRASCSSAASTPCANSARRLWRPHDRRSARAALHHADAPRPAPGMLVPPPPDGRPS